MAEINDLLYQLRLADQSTTQLFEKRLGISLTRYQILQDLLEQAPCNQIAVQERLQIDPAALTRHFKILEKEGFVHRSRNPKNQREILIHLTDTAYNRLVKHPPRHHVAVKEQMNRILTAQEQEQFSYLLDKLVQGTGARAEVAGVDGDRRYAQPYPYLECTPKLVCKREMLRFQTLFLSLGAL